MASMLTRVCFIFLASIYCLFPAVWSFTQQDRVITEELVQRFNEIESIQRNQQVEILAQKQTIEQQDKGIDQHAKRIDQQAKRIEQQAETIKQQAKEIAFLKDHCGNDRPDESHDIKLDTGTTFTEKGGDSDEASQSYEYSALPLRAIKGTLTRGQVIYRRHKRQEGSVAFTAYLDHNVELGRLQTLKLNKIITNEGGGYNNHTGIFTCPTTGLYMLAFYIGERSDGDHGVWMKLVINSQNVVDAAVDTFHATQDLQGGNLVVTRLHQGDVVWIERHVYDNSHVEGSPSLRLTTFSGVLLHQ